MGIINVIEGSFPVQTAIIARSSIFLKTKASVLLLKGYDKRDRLYVLRNAVKSLETVIDHKKKPTIKLILNDGNIVIGKADLSFIEQIKIALSLGPEEGQPLTMEPPSFLKQKSKPEKAQPYNWRDHFRSRAAFTDFLFQLGNALLWLLTGFIGLLALTSLFSIGGGGGLALFLMVIAIFISPPVLRKVVASVNKNAMARGVAIGIVCLIILMVVIINIGGQRAEKRMEQKRQEVEQQQIADLENRKQAFIENKDSIIAELKAALAAKDYQKAYDAASPYMGFDDKDLEALYAVANDKVQAKAAEQAQIERQHQLLDGARVYENFLQQTEEQFKTLKPSEADMETVRKTLAVFGGAAEELDKMRQIKADLTPESITYLKGLERRLSALQQKTLPGMRQAYAKKVGRELWRNDVYVSAGGERNTVIKFASYMFSANANIDDAQKAMHENVTKLRFKQTRYMLFKDADEYTHYKLNTPSDADLMMFKFGEFQKMSPGY